jgi:H+/Cl- antiporter ClcA
VARERGWLLGYATIIPISLAYGLVAFLLTAYLSPAAAGSGVAEAMGILNGVKYPDFICLKALIVKFLGVGFAVSAGLCVGKEGPLVHMGSIVGCAIPYLPIGIAKYFRNDFEKRKLMSVGIASGVSAAFGAPIGGALFAYEISKPNTFWSFSLTWKVFFASTIATFSLSLFK